MLTVEKSKRSRTAGPSPWCVDTLTGAELGEVRAGLWGIQTVSQEQGSRGLDPEPQQGDSGAGAWEQEVGKKSD